MYEKAQNKLAEEEKNLKKRHSAIRLILRKFQELDAKDRAYVRSLLADEQPKA